MSGSNHELGEFFHRVYDEIHALASRRLHREATDHTLNPTALVHEVYLRFSRQDKSSFRNRRHFLATASMMIRRILVDHARARKARDQLTCVEVARDVDHDEDGDARLLWDVLALHEALERLAGEHPRKARLVELRFFGGLTLQECAEEFDITVRSVTNDWAFARAWLHRALAGTGRTTSGETSP